MGVCKLSHRLWLWFIVAFNSTMFRIRELSKIHVCSDQIITSLNHIFISYKTVLHPFQNSRWYELNMKKFSDLTFKTSPDPSLQSKLSLFALCQTISIIIHPGNNTSKTSQLSETLIGLFHPIQASDWLIRSLLITLLAYDWWRMVTGDRWVFCIFIPPLLHHIMSTDQRLRDFVASSLQLPYVLRLRSSSPSLLTVAHKITRHLQLFEMTFLF